jgi:hypothetical protein
MLSKRTAPPGRRAAKKVREKSQQVPDLFQRVRDLLRRAATSPTAAAIFRFFYPSSHFRGTREGLFFPKKEQGTAALVSTKVKTEHLFLNFV